jgi:hypothetical protein
MSMEGETRSCLPLWERWHGEAVTEGVRHAATLRRGRGSMVRTRAGEHKRTPGEKPLSGGSFCVNNLVGDL